MQPQRPRRRPTGRLYMPWDVFRKPPQHPPPPRTTGQPAPRPAPPDPYSSPSPARPVRPRLVEPPRPAPPQPQYTYHPAQPAPSTRRHLRLPWGGCLILFLPLALLVFVGYIYLVWPGRINILALGIDHSDPDSLLGRSDTIILTTFVPSRPYVGMLSIPRDLWVNIPGYGENRINTAHFFAEAQQEGSGPYTSMQTIQQNFGIQVTYYVRIRFPGFRDMVDALGGLDIELTEPMAGYEPGKYHLTGNKALAFARSRTYSDDFHRMGQGQYIIKAFFQNLLKPTNWLRIPAVTKAFFDAVETNVPVSQWPRLGFVLLRVGPSKIDNRVINSEMTTPFSTNEGASVLAPQWDMIYPVLIEMFIK